MSTSDLQPLSPEDTFCFDCHPGLPCFNQCCRDLNQALTPYDIVRMRAHLHMTSGQFMQTYTTAHTGPTTGLPIVSLCFSSRPGQTCPFVSPDGCRIYAARPSSCRLYPLARALHRSRSNGRLSEHYAIIREPHCQGFEQKRRQNIRQWIASQELDVYNTMNDRLMQLISLKNRLRPGPLSPDHQQWAMMALYDLDTLKARAVSGRLPELDQNHLQPLPPRMDDEAWLRWSMEWIRTVLFGDIKIE